MMVMIEVMKVVKNQLVVVDDIVPAGDVEIFPSGDAMVKFSGRKLPEAVRAGKFKIIKFFS